MLTANHSHPVSLAQSFHSCSCLQFLFMILVTMQHLCAATPHPNLNPILKILENLISLHKVCFYYCYSSSSQDQAQRGAGNEAINTQKKTAKAAQPKRKQRAEKTSKRSFIINKATASPSQLSLLFSICTECGTHTFWNPSLLRMYLLPFWLNIIQPKLILLQAVFSMVRICVSAVLGGYLAILEILLLEFVQMKS